MQDEPPKSPRVLAFGAHPDDVEIYCLGLLLKLQKMGWTVGWVVATDGQAGVPANAPHGLRRQEALNAGALVGVIPIFLGLEDGALREDPGSSGGVRQAIADFQPDLIISPSTNDYHPDHRALSRLVNSECPVRTALLEADTMMGVDFLPEFSVDISAEFETKMACLRAHVSQTSNSFMDNHLKTWNSFRGLQTAKPDVLFAESYRIRRAFGRKSPLQLLGGLAL